ncbi:MAG TPA: isopeptide-forming domain-containing fimbrial protein [Polyangiales bacterium]
MRKFALTLLTVSALTSSALADQKLRVQVDQRGDFMMIGNTLGWDCGAGAPAPLVGTVPTDCGITSFDTSADAFWRADEPGDGQATASLSYTAADARSTSYLDLPDGAVVSHAFLYWGARREVPAADTSATLERPGVFTQTVFATASSSVPAFAFGYAYQSVADVTSLVRAHGDGPFRVSGVDVTDLPSTHQEVLFAGWGLVVFYRLDSDPPRNLALFDGLDAIDIGGQSSVALSGFLVPNAGFDAKFGVLVYEGDEALSGDSLLFGQGSLTQANALSDAENPTNNFFNGTRSLLGKAVSHAGDLPRLSGQPSTMAGLDLDVVDVTSRVVGGQTSVNLRATTTLDSYFLGAFITSISTFRPDFNGSTKTVRDVNGGALVPGDQLEYTITVTNNGNDASANAVLRDTIPTGTTFVPGSINVTRGDNAGVKTDAAGDDQGSYDATTRTVNVNLGAGATASQGGAIAVGQSSVVVFRVKVDPTTRGIISNQGRIEASGQRGAPSATTVTDGNADGPGAPTTDIPVAGCGSNADCGGATPVCDLTQMPPVCVQCTEDTQCPGPGSTCDASTNTCKCNGQPMSCMDSDNDGLSDPDEIDHGTNPNDADSDDDGVADGSEVTPFTDSDGDLLINALDPDSDDDALFDGTEQGYDCNGPGTDARKGHCRPDADRTTRTDPTADDSDKGGAIDGSEDTNLNGKVDGEERDPTSGHGADDRSVIDSDGDELSDPLEDTLGSDPRDRDTDNDGLLDGDERNPSDDTDGDKLNNTLDVDSDDDVLLDGTESGKDCRQPDTQPGHCIPDGDQGATTTSPVIADTDRGGARDGSEDSDRDGVLDPSERDPTVGHGADDANIPDSDGDGLSDPTEVDLGSDPNDADTDDDGQRDGNEANPADDTDGDGKINVLDPDSDGDMLGDGTERGSQCTDPQTDRSKDLCTPDGDMGAATTSMVNPDTDFGGVPDGIEDTDRDGTIDPGERNPNDPRDDAPTRDAGMPELEPSDAGFGNTNVIAGGGCDCSVQPTWSTGGWWLLALAGLLRRRR